MVNPIAVTWFCHLVYSSPHLGGGGGGGQSQRDFPLAGKDVQQNKGS